jgi:steroid delta-isomerase-like uncharacterized protein
MPTDENRAVVRKFFAALDEQNMAAVEDLLAPNYRLHFDAMPEMDRQAGIGFFGAFLAAFPDIRHEVQDQLAEGDGVATRIVVSGRNQGEFMGMPATGKAIRVGAINLIRLNDAKIAEHWINADSLGMMQQLGAIPSP